MVTNDTHHQLCVCADTVHELIMGIYYGKRYAFKFQLQCIQKAYENNIILHATRVAIVVAMAS